MRNIEKKLIKKGWKPSDVNKTLKIIERAKAKKHPHIKILDKAVYWFSLLLAIGGNFIISIALIPELLTLRSFQLYIILITLGISFGLLFELLIRSIENLETKYHIFLGTIIPIIAVLNFIIIVLFSNRIGEILKIDNPQNPLLVGIAFAVSFMLPYVIYQFFLKDKY